MKKLIALLLALAMAFALVSCGSNSSNASSAPAAEPSAEEPAAASEPATEPEAAPAAENDGTVYTMRIGTLTVEAEQNTATAIEFGTRIEEATNGQVVVEVYPSAQLGTAAQMIEGMQTGTIEGALFPTDYLASAAPTVGFISVPGVAGTDIDSLCAVMNEMGGVDVANEYLTPVGLHMVGVLYTDTYTYLLADHEVTSLADTQGLKLWAPPSDYTSALIEGMGGTSTFFDTSDVAVSIQQGTIDGCMASPALYAAQKLFESHKYCMGLVGRCGATALTLSESFLQSLPEDLRQTVLDVALDTIIDFEYPYAAAAAETNLQVLADNDCKVYYSDEYPELQAQLEELYAENLDLFLNSSDEGQAVYDTVHPLLEQYQAG